LTPRNGASSVERVVVVDADAAETTRMRPSRVTKRRDVRRRRARLTAMRDDDDDQ
jgi:hypothetical protein